MQVSGQPKLFSSEHCQIESMDYSEKKLSEKNWKEMKIVIFENVVDTKKMFQKFYFSFNLFRKCLTTTFLSKTETFKKTVEILYQKVCHNVTKLSLQPNILEKSLRKTRTRVHLRKNNFDVSKLFQSFDFSSKIYVTTC